MEKRRKNKNKEQTVKVCEKNKAEEQNIQERKLEVNNICNIRITKEENALQQQRLTNKQTKQNVTSNIKQTLSNVVQ